MPERLSYPIFEIWVFYGDILTDLSAEFLQLVEGKDNKLALVVDMRSPLLLEIPGYSG